MALYKEIALNNGVVLNYHKISSVRISPIDAEQGYELYIFVDSYVSQSKRAESLGYTVESNGYDATVSKDIIESTPIFTVAYDVLKTLEVFEGALDA